MKLIFKPFLPRCGNWQVPNQPKGKYCVVCAAGKSRTESYIGSMRVLDHCLPCSACSQNIWLGNESIKAWNKICPCY